MLLQLCVPTSSSMRHYADPVPALKAQLAREIVARVERPGGVSGALLTVIGGPRLSNLRLSRLDRFSVQGLIRTLTRLGYEVQVTLTSPEEIRQRNDAATRDAIRAAGAQAAMARR